MKTCSFEEPVVACIDSAADKGTLDQTVGQTAHSSHCWQSTRKKPKKRLQA